MGVRAYHGEQCDQCAEEVPEQREKAQRDQHVVDVHGGGALVRGSGAEEQRNFAGAVAPRGIPFSPSPLALCGTVEKLG